MVKFALRDEPDPHPWLGASLQRLVQRQYGHISRRQLLDAGFSDGLIYSWLRRDRLHRVHHGVYAVGYPRIEPIALAAAAVLAGGPAAVLSHGSAAALWGLIRRWPQLPEVTTPRDRRAGAIHWHRASTLQPSDIRTHQGIRTTSAARTLLDIAARLTDPELERMVSTVRIDRRASTDAIDELTGRLPTCPGATRLRAIALGGAGPTRSQLERRFLALLRRHHLPLPQLNVRVAGFEVDCLFAPERLIVELDGFEFHRDHVRFVRDRRRDARTLLAGYETVRLTDADLRPGREAATARLIAAHLERRRRELGTAP